MTRSLMRSLMLLAFGGLTVATLQAQNADSMTTARVEESLVRMRRLSANDIGVARMLADSLVASVPLNATVFAELLFAKASIAPSAGAAQRDYLRIVNEYRFSTRVPDALMRLAVLENARNNRAGSLRHLDRLLRDHSDAPVRSRAALLAAQLRLDADDLARACDLLAAAYASAGANERDVRDQSETLGARCPSSIAEMAMREPPPLGVKRAAGSAVATSITAGTTTPSRRTSRRDSISASRSAALPAAAPVVRRDTLQSPRANTPVIVPRRDTVVAAKPVEAAVVVAPPPVAPPTVAPPTVATPTVATPTVATPTVATPTAVTPTVVTPTVATPTVVTPTPAAPRRDTVATLIPTPAAPIVRRDTVRTPVTASTNTVRFGVQFAAYNDRPGAEKYASQLRERGIAARVEGVAAPFRVRAGRYGSRAEAEAQATLWRRPGQAAMVVALGPTP
jgi:cell division protein FtsN